MTLYRHRWIRWVAAVAAAVLVAGTFGSDDTGESSEPLDGTAITAADRLPAETRGVPVPVDNMTFSVGDSVDVHAVIDGAAVVRSALIVEVADRQAVVAVSVHEVDALVDALATGGVILVLAPADAGTSETSG